jgi:hypothetical protein
MQMASHRCRGRKTHRGNQDRRESKSVSTLSHPEWPNWPFSSSACVQHSSELMPATCPRWARGRTNAREIVKCTGLATRVVATALLASPGHRGGEMQAVPVIGRGQESPLQVPPHARSNNRLTVYRGSIRLTTELNLTSRTVRSRFARRFPQ